MEGNCRLVATDDFYPQAKGDLGFTKGQVIDFISVVDANWGRGHFDGRRGIFPLGFTKRLDPSPHVGIQPLLHNNLMIKNSNQKPSIQTAPFAHGVIRQRNNTLASCGFDIGDICLILAQNDLGAWWIKGTNQKVLLVDREMVEITKMLDGVWKRKSIDDELKRVPKSSDSKKLPDRSAKKEKRYSWSPGKTDLEFNVKHVDVDGDKRNGNGRVRPKSYAEPTDTGDYKRRSYQEATEGEWEKAIIDRIVEQDTSKGPNASLSRNQTGRKSIKDLLRNKLNLDSTTSVKISSTQQKAHYSHLKDQLEKHEKEKRKLEDRYNVGTDIEKKIIKNMIRMEESQLRRLKRELDKNEVKHSRMSSAPVSLGSSDGYESNGDEVQLINALYELRDTELSFYNDIKFILDEVVPTIHHDIDLLFSGLHEIMELSQSLYYQFVDIAAMEDRYLQCQTLSAVFLEEMVDLRAVYAPYCSRQTEASVKAGQINNATTDVIISTARREGRTKAFNLNSLLIKPVQRVTKYPLLLQQVTPPIEGASDLREILHQFSLKQNFS